MINASHMLGAFYGLERILGRDFSPVRKVFDYAEEHFLQRLPLCYVAHRHHRAARAKSACTACFLGARAADVRGRRRAGAGEKHRLRRKADPQMRRAARRDEFKTTWLGNKAVYRTRMAIADGGELVVLGAGRWSASARIWASTRSSANTATAGALRPSAACKENARSAARIWARQRTSFTVRPTAASPSPTARRRLPEAEIRRVHYGWAPYAEAAEALQSRRAQRRLEHAARRRGNLFRPQPCAGFVGGQSAIRRELNRSQTKTARISDNPRRRFFPRSAREILYLSFLLLADGVALLLPQREPLLQPLEEFAVRLRPLQHAHQLLGRVG